MGKPRKLKVGEWYQTRNSYTKLFSSSEQVSYSHSFENPAICLEKGSLVFILEDFSKIDLKISTISLVTFGKAFKVKVLYKGKVGYLQFKKFTDLEIAKEND